MYLAFIDESGVINHIVSTITQYFYSYILMLNRKLIKF